ncbi:MAG TPA: tRNA pseudouridine(38-40) synthase TruA [Opitutaceae bacterium]|nr:tRNA pseudouridine(38-40) synthase TruA [Opitutaceae bacterium]
MSRWKCVCAYDGTDFSGWQSQQTKDSVQDTLEARLEAILKMPTRIHGSGRTDAGVHAAGQVFHFDAEWKHGAEKLAAALRFKLPKSIQIVSVRPVGRSFHARFSAKRKVYTYNIYLGDADPFTRPYCWSVLKPLDLAAMKSAAAVLVGRHDFKSFSAYNGAEPGEAGDTTRNLRRLDVRVRGKNVRVIAEADGFLYRMVRSLVGALVSVGEGRLTEADLRSILGSNQRTERVQTAPPQGLFLTKVSYR